jgi:hypothetical protein
MDKFVEKVRMIIFGMCTSLEINVKVWVWGMLITYVVNAKFFPYSLLGEARRTGMKLALSLILSLFLLKKLEIPKL